VLVVEHDRDDQDDDVTLPCGGRPVGCGPEVARGVCLAHKLGEAGLLGDVRVARVDRRHDGFLDVHGSDVPAVGGELGGDRQTHLAGPDDGDPAGRPLVSGPGPDRSGDPVQA
jgi:hypothetical protein